MNEERMFNSKEVGTPQKAPAFAQLMERMNETINVIDARSRRIAEKVTLLSGKHFDAAPEETTTEIDSIVGMVDAGLFRLESLANRIGQIENTLNETI